MLKFVHHTDCVGQKRKQSQRACGQCRRKKKRCMHDSTAGGASNSQSPKLEGHRHRGSSANAGILEDTVTTTTNAGQSSEEQHGNDFFDYNTSLQVKNTSATDATIGDRDRDSSAEQHSGSEPDQSNGPSNLGSRFIGDLNPEGIFLAHTTPDSSSTPLHSSVGIWLAERLGNIGSHPRSTLFDQCAPTIQKVLLPLLEEECLSIVPPQESFEALSAIYLEKLHPIFPVLDPMIFRKRGTPDRSSTILRQAICLLASVHSEARDHLVLPGAPKALDPREFSKRVFASMRTAIELGLVTDKIVLIQALTLMSFSMEGPDGRDLSSQLCARAVECTYSIGLHIEGLERAEKKKYAVCLLCCVWAMDKLQAAFHGRPVLMHERDMRKDMDECFEQQEPCFRLFLQVIGLLDKVIDLYRPRSDPDITGWEGNFPSFEELLLKSSGVLVRTPLLATIETFYHAVSILSCRSRLSEPAMTSSTSYVRQSLSASRVTSIVGVEFRHQLSLFSFVPYAVSLSLSISYREMRHGKIPMYRARARISLQDNCSILEWLGETFWQASAMAEMAKSTLQELDRVCHTMAESHHHHLHKPQPASADRSGRGILAQQTRRIDASSSSTDTAHQGASGDGSGNDGGIGAAGSGHGANDHAPADRDVLGGWDFQDIDSVLFNDEDDLFGLFDPNFNLENIDACLEGNLDLSFPTCFQ